MGQAEMLIPTDGTAAGFTVASLIAESGNQGRFPKPKGKPQPPVLIHYTIRLKGRSEYSKPLSEAVLHFDPAYTPGNYSPPSYDGVTGIVVVCYPLSEMAAVLALLNAGRVFAVYYETEGGKNRHFFLSLEKRFPPKKSAKDSAGG